MEYSSSFGRAPSRAADEPREAIPGTAARLEASAIAGSSGRAATVGAWRRESVDARRAETRAGGGARSRASSGFFQDSAREGGKKKPPVSSWQVLSDRSFEIAHSTTRVCPSSGGRRDRRRAKETKPSAAETFLERPPQNLRTSSPRVCGRSPRACARTWTRCVRAWRRPCRRRSCSSRSRRRGEASWRGVTRRGEACRGVSWRGRRERRERLYGAPMVSRPPGVCPGYPSRTRAWWCQKLSLAPGTTFLLFW